MKKRTIIHLIIMNVICACLSSWVHAQPPVGGTLPDFKLPMPSFSEKKYLGLTGFGSFRVPDIRAKIVLIEIFSMYCPYCQKDAPQVNQLYQKIQQDERTKGAIKMIGIGAGNSSYEVDLFKKKYGVPFPLFPDGDYTIHKKLGEVRTPYFIAVKLNPDGTHRVVYSKLGSFGDVDQFLAMLKQAADVI